jgi:hypothetical protein
MFTPDTVMVLLVESPVLEAFGLVLQPQLYPSLTALDVGHFGARLMASTPGRPVQNVRGGGWRVPEQREEQSAHFRHSERQQRCCRAYDAAFFLCDLPLFWVCCACQRTTVR